MGQIYENSIFWVDVEKIKPNPYQPRREFDQSALEELSLSIKQYGLLQPLTVSRIEIPKEDGGMVVEYELIAGERRLRASKLAGLSQVPVIIRTGDDAMTKLELAIIENLQREDLNAVERARAFARLAEEFKFTHGQIGQKVGKSREYVSNTIRLLTLPEEVLNALSEGKISEGHTRPLMMLSDRPDEQITLFKEIMYKKITVREAERVARSIAQDKIRKKELEISPEINQMEQTLRDTLGTRVHIEKKDTGGKITIDFFSDEDLHSLIAMLNQNKSNSNPNAMLERFEKDRVEVKNLPAHEVVAESVPENNLASNVPEVQPIEISVPDYANFIPNLPVEQNIEIPQEALDDRSEEEKKMDEENPDLYNINSFSV